MRGIGRKTTGEHHHALGPIDDDGRVSPPLRDHLPVHATPLARSPGRREQSTTVTGRSSIGGDLVIDVAGYLTKSEVKRLQTRMENIQRDTGVKLRILAQAYPQTPGLAIKEYWGVDDDTVVFVADPGLGNILNFSVGANVDLEVPPNFWTKLANKYGTKFYWADKGEEASIVAATDAIEFCLNEPSGRAKCSTVLDVDEGLAKEDVKRDAKATAGGFNLKLPF